MYSGKTKLPFLSFVLLAVAGIAVGQYVNNDKHQQNNTLAPLVIGSWVKIPGVCDGKTHYDGMIEILSRQSIRVRGKVMSIVEFSISKTSPVKISCDAIGEGEMFAQTSFIGDRFSRFYVGKIGDYTIMKNVAPKGELWFKLDTHFKKKLQAMRKRVNRHKL